MRIKLVTNLLAGIVLALGGCSVLTESGIISGGVAVKELRCEYRINPLGIDVVNPRLSWIMESNQRWQKQSAYQILVADSEEHLKQNEGNLWDSGKVNSEQSNQIVYDGVPLKSRMRCWWKVRVCDMDGKASAWSEPATWSMGLLEPSNWKAQWIANAKDDPVNETGPMPATMLRKSFAIEGPIKRATVYVTGLGLYELHLNGMRVGNHILAPEWTCYGKRVQYQTFDVTDMVVSGDNTVGAILGDGWHGDRFFGMPPPGKRPFKGRRGFIMRLDIELVDGKTQTIVTDKSWRSTRDGAIRSGSIYDGELYDARMEMPGWDKLGFDDTTWNQAVIADYLAGANLVWQRNEPIRVVKELKPVKITEPKPGLHVFDLGQNMVGWCRLKVRGPAGRTVKLRHAEMLNDDGTIYTANLRSAQQTEIYTKRTDGEEMYEPHFTYYGFRYVELTGISYKPEVGDVLGRVFHSASPDAGHFQCSSELINQIMHMIVWVQRGNMHSIPTDCPQRDERAGWMGDIQAFSQTAIFNMDMAGFFSKWVQDVRDSQADDGRYPNFAPMLGKSWQGGTPAWADAGTVVPWRMYQNYGDTRMLAEHYESARRWVDYVHSKNPNLLWEKSLGNKFNDWLNGDTLVMEGWPKTGGAVPPHVLATAFFAHSTEIVSKMAAVIGRTDDAKKYVRLFEGIKAAFNEKYVEPDGRIEGNTQAGYALALRFNLLPDKLRSKSAKHMVQEFERYNGHMSTGIQTSHRLMLELTRNGYNNEAYLLLNLRTFPSWGFMIEQGATTIWERWDGYVKGRGFQNPGMNSFNHWALGAVGEWMWRNIIGLNPDESKPGWKHFTIAPRSGVVVTWARGEYKSIRGTIISDWRIENGNFRLDVTVPPNTTATVYVPAKDIESVTEGGQPAAKAKSVCLLRMEDDRVVFAVGSGHYRFVSKLPD